MTPASASASASIREHHGIVGVFCKMDLFTLRGTHICVGFKYEYIVFKYKVQNSNNELSTTLETGGVYAMSILLISISGLFSNGIQFCASDKLLLWGPDPSVWSVSKGLFSGLFVF